MPVTPAATDLTGIVTTTMLRHASPLTPYFVLLPSVATQLYPVSPGSRPTTPLADYESVYLQAAMSNLPVSDIVPVVPVQGTSRFVPLSPQFSPVSAEVMNGAGGGGGVVLESSDLPTTMSRFSPLGPPVAMEAVDQVVVKSPTLYNTQVALLDVAPVVEHVPLMRRRCRACHRFNFHPF